MKKQTLKKAMALIIATLMLALATPFAIMTVGAEEATPTQLEILYVDLFGRHIKEDTPIGLNFYASFPADCAFDGDITTDAQILNNDEVGNLPYEMCYFDAEGNMENGTNPDANGKSYYAMFIIELNEAAVVDTLSLWTPYAQASTSNADRPYMANNGYDIYYSEDGGAFSAVEGATFSNVYTEYPVNGFYVEGEYNGKSGHVHEIDMKGVTAEYIVIAVSELVSGADEGIISEVVLTGTAIVDEEDEENENNGNNDVNNNENNANDDNNTSTTPETDANTEANTEAAPAPETEAAKGGCVGSIGIAGIAMISLVSGAALVIKRKKD